MASILPCGMKNPASLCYMISVIQQLFALEDFRARFSDVKDDVGPISTLLSSLFSKLKAGVDGTEDLVRLHSVLKSEANDERSIFTQADIADFLSDLLSRLSLEGGAEMIQWLNNTIYGELTNLIYVPGDENRRISMNEKFFYVSIRLGATKQALQQSLTSFVRPEKVKYSWNSSDSAGSSAVNTNKITEFKRLPNHLIFHLKRFRYDADSRRKEKLHDYFEFPMECDMAAYTQEPSDDDSPDISSRFRLSGCVVHKGSSAYSGHYYSIIRSRTEAGRWFKLDDEVVSVLPEEATELNEYFSEELFGGFWGEESDDEEDSNDGEATERLRCSEGMAVEDLEAETRRANEEEDSVASARIPRSAMMLIYDRIAS